MTDFKAIAASFEERGFCVVPEFPSRAELDFLVAEFDASPDFGITLGDILPTLTGERE